MNPTVKMHPAQEAPAWNEISPTRRFPSDREVIDMPTLRVALVFSFLIIAIPLVAQVQGNAHPYDAETQATVQNPPESAEASGPARKFRIISETQTANYIAKFGSAGATIDSILFENNGKIGLNTTDP